MAEPAVADSVIENPAPEAIPGASPDEKWARTIRERAVHPSSHNPAAITTLSETDPQADFEKLEPGKKFIGKDKQVRVKPYTVANDSDFDSVPEGALFTDPFGKTRTKPKFEPIDYTSQTLYDMAITDSERKKALEHSYPGKVKQDTLGEYYVDEGEVKRKPGRGVSSVTGFASAAAAPTALSAGGALLGGAMGPFTAAAGAAGGAALGQGFNDIILGLTSGLDRTTAEELTNLGESAAMSAGGEVIGRGAAAFVPSIKAGMSNVGAALPGAVRKFTGATPENLEMAESLSKKGVMVPPSAVLKESPHIINVAERFDPAFRTQKPFLESATAHYDKSTEAILDKFGVKQKESLIKPKSAVPTQEAGAAIIRRGAAESQEANAAFQAALDKKAAELQVGAGEKVAQREVILKTAEEARQKAQALIDHGFNDIKQDVDAAVKLSGAGGNSGELWDMVGKKLQALKKAIQDKHTEWYNQADQAAAGHLPNSAGLSSTAEEFLSQMPEGFESRYPSIVKKLRDMAGAKNEETGEWIKEPVQPTFGQLHNLRSDLRNNVRWYEIAPDIKDGVYKFFSKKVDDIIHDPNASKELKTASQILDATDKSYGENMKIFNDSRIGAVIKGLESGQPADPKVLYETIVKEGRTDLTKTIEKMVGPNLWAGVKAADIQEMLDASKGYLPGEIDGNAFARQVLDRHRSNMLETVHGKEASAKLLEQARNVALLNGKNSIQVRPGDTLTTVIGRARQAADEAKRVANQDPLGTLSREMKKVEAARANSAAKLKAANKNDPLNFLLDPTTGADEAVNKILANEDMIRAASFKFGKDSPEFNMLRQIYAQRVLRETMTPSKNLAKISDEIQQLMFPGTTRSDIETLAKEMDFLMGAKVFQGGDVAGGMSAMSKVENPIGGKIVGSVTKAVPGVNTIGRSTRGKYYQVITDFVSKNPALFSYMMKGLKGTEEEKQAVRQALSKVLQRGGSVGAGAGAAVQEGGTE